MVTEERGLSIKAVACSGGFFSCGFFPALMNFHGNQKRGHAKSETGVARWSTPF